MGLHQGEGPLEPFAGKLNAQLPLAKSLAHFALGAHAVVKPGACLVGGIDAAVPYDDLARAVLARRDHAFERAVAERVVLGRHGEPLFATIERWALTNRPRLE